MVASPDLRPMIGRHGELQHSGTLARPQLGNEHQLSVGEFQCIVVRIAAVYAEASETCDRRFKFAEAKVRKQAGKWMATFSLPLEGDFCPRQQANCYLRLSDRRKASRVSIGKFCRDEVISDLRGSGSDGVEAVVTHGKLPSLRSTFAGCEDAATCSSRDDQPLQLR